jgi:deoxyxylulose-5-phosphate synthase
LNAAILEFVQEEALQANVHSMAIGDYYVDQGDSNLIYKDIALDEETLLNLIKKINRSS